MCEGAACPDDAGVGVADEAEQFHETLPHRGALVCGQHREQVQQAPERVVHVPAGEVEVRDAERGIHVGRVVRRGAARILERHVLHALQQPHLAETGAGILVARVLRERLLVRADRARVVARLDRVVGLGVQGRQRRLLGGGDGLAVADRKRPGHAVLRGQLQQLGEDLAHLLFRHGTGEQRHRLTGHERDDHRDRLRAEAGGQLRVGVDVDLGEQHAAGELQHDLLQHGAQLLAGAAPFRPEVDDHRDGPRQFEHVAERLIGDVDDEARDRQRLAGRSRCSRRGRRAAAQGGEVDGAAQRRAQVRVAHFFLFTFAERMSDA